jgi:hypothetical protein
VARIGPFAELEAARRDEITLYTNAQMTENLAFYPALLRANTDKARDAYPPGHRRHRSDSTRVPVEQ